MALTVEDIVARLEAANHEHTPVLAVRDVLDELVADPSRLAAALGPVEHGGIQPLHHTPELTVLHVAWTPGMALNPHEHRMWAAIGMYGGQEDNAFYRRTDHGLEPSGGKDVVAGDVLIMGDDAVHSVTNNRREYAVALHVYGGDFFAADGRSEWEFDTLEERPRDMTRTMRLFEEANARWAAESA
jgi:predicted metal-dependent enzyme (double-stranded beta helix superfamily)